MKKNNFAFLFTLIGLILLLSPAVVFAEGETQAASRDSQPLYYNTRGGDSYDTAVLPPLGQDLKLNHHQKKGEYDYFEVDLKAGQTLKANLSVGEKGIEVRPDSSTLETGYPYAGLIVYDAGGHQVGILDFAGSEKNLQKTLEVDASTPQRIYLLLGSGTGAMNKDYVGFRVDVQNNFDADGTGEAGATLETALAIDPAKKDYKVNFLTRNDEADFFKLTTKPGQALALEILPNNPRTTLNAALYDELRVEMARGRSENPGVPVKVNAKANTSTTFLKVTRELSDEPTEYEMKFMAPPPETAPAETRPLALAPETLALATGSPESKIDVKKDIEDMKAKMNERETEFDKKHSKGKNQEKAKPATKTAWWKNSKMVTYGGAAAGGILVLLLGGLILLRKSKAKKSTESS